MKFVYPLALAALSLTTTQAQDTASEPGQSLHLFDFGVGPVLNGAGDIACLKTHLGYTRTLNRHFSGGPRLALVSRNDENYYVNGPYVLSRKYQAINLEGEMYYAPFGNDRQFIFSLGAGAYTGYTTARSYEWISYGVNEDNIFELTYKRRNTDGLHVGYIASLNADHTLGFRRRWLIGMRLSTQNNNYAHIVSGLQFRVSHRL